MATRKKVIHVKSTGREKDPDAVFDSWQIGDLKFRVSILDKEGRGKVSWQESGPERKVRLHRQALFKAIRADLELTQSEMAAALHIATKTLQGYEIGKPIPEPIFILAELIRDFPGVRKRLLAA